jgi:uncharacterized protein YegL
MSGKSSKTTVTEVKDLFKSAVSVGDLDNKSAEILIDNLDGTNIMGCLGAGVDDLSTDDVTLCGVILDMSYSMAGEQKVVIEAFNSMMQSMKDSKQEESILVSAWVFADHPELLFGYTPVAKVQELTEQEYSPRGSTSLYDAQLNALTGLVAYGQQLRDRGIRTKNIVVVLSDGADNTSKTRDTQVKKVADDLTARETYALAFAGFKTGEPVDFRLIAQNTGFPSIITVSSTASEIRRIFGLVSKSVIRVSQTTVNKDKSSFFAP